MNKTKRYAYEPDYAVPPGETLFDVISSLGMSQKEFAIRTGLTEQSLNRIKKGVQPISYETANRLELVTSVPAGFWNNLEMQYRQQLLKKRERERLKQSLEWLKIIPVKELQSRGYIGVYNDKGSIVRDTLAFYGTHSVDAWHEIWSNPEVCPRRSRCFETRIGPASAWIRQGELQAQDIECKPYDRQLFMDTLHAIRALTKEPQDTVIPESRRLCAESGVALALVREMPKVPWNGAMRWLTPHKAMILLSLRGKGEDRFWFSFFHEAAHVLNGSRKQLFINTGEQEDDEEIRADHFAAEFLIPSEYNDAIRRLSTETEIVRFAKKLDIAPGIVAGRYQFLTKKWNYFRNLICSFDWSE